MAERKRGLTYAAAGVDINAGNEAVRLMKNSVRSTYRPEVLGDIGGFAGFFSLNAASYREPVLVAGSDGVGTKLRIAFLMDRHDTVGIDAVAMCVNDILVHGAEPLFFLDYLAMGKLVPEKVAAIVEGVAEGCRRAGCALLGGETAEMPGFYGPDEYDLAGFAVGIVEKDQIVDGKSLAPGDRLVGLPSSGLHSNGFSLARKALFEAAGYGVHSVPEGLGRTLGEELLEPTRIYVKTVLPLLDRFWVKGMCHITGGGLTENLPRILPPGLSAVIETGSWPVPPIFELIAEAGGVEREEMLRTFNMGVGFVLAVPARQTDDLIADLAESGEAAYVIGEIAEGGGKVVYV